MLEFWTSPFKTSYNTLYFRVANHLKRPDALLQIVNELALLSNFPPKTLRSSAPLLTEGWQNLHAISVISSLKERQRGFDDRVHEKKIT